MALYQAGASRGISARELDDCRLYEVRWMFAPVEDPDAPESDAEYRQAIAEAMAAKAAGKERPIEVAGMKVVG